jgi:hypothetical protein
MVIREMVEAKYKADNILFSVSCGCISMTLLCRYENEQFVPANLEE